MSRAFSLCVWSLLAFLVSGAVAQPACVPTETVEPRILLEWPALTAIPDGYTLTAWRLQRTGDHPAILPPVAPDAVTVTETVPPGAHAWQLKAEFVRVADGATVLSNLAPLGEPPPCVVVRSTPPPPTLNSLVPTTTMSGAPGLHLRWTLDGPDRPVQIVRRSDPAQPWSHVGSAPGGFWFDLFALDPGVTYCYRACLLNVEPDTCSEERCVVFPTIQ